MKEMGLLSENAYFSTTTNPLPRFKDVKGEDGKIIRYYEKAVLENEPALKSDEKTMSGCCGKKKRKETKPLE